MAFGALGRSSPFGFQNTYPGQQSGLWGGMGGGPGMMPSYGSPMFGNAGVLGGMGGGPGMMPGRYQRPPPHWSGMPGLGGGQLGGTPYQGGMAPPSWAAPSYNRMRGRGQMEARMPYQGGMDRAYNQFNQDRGYNQFRFPMGPGLNTPPGWSIGDLEGRLDTLNRLRGGNPMFSPVRTDPHPAIGSLPYQSPPGYNFITLDREQLFPGRPRPPGGQFPTPPVNPPWGQFPTPPSSNPVYGPGMAPSYLPPTPGVSPRYGNLAQDHTAPGSAAWDNNQRQNLGTFKKLFGNPEGYGSLPPVGASDFANMRAASLTGNPWLLSDRRGL